MWTILYIITGFYLLGVIGRWALRSWVRREQRKFERSGGNPAGGFYRTYTWGTGTGQREAQQPPRQEGEVTVRRTHAEEKKVDRTIGDYVEYEDVEVGITEVEEKESI